MAGHPAVVSHVLVGDGGGRAVRRCGGPRIIHEKLLHLMWRLRRRPPTDRPAGAESLRHEFGMLEKLLPRKYSAFVVFPDQSREHLFYMVSSLPPCVAIRSRLSMVIQLGA